MCYYTSMISEIELADLYQIQQLSVKQIAAKLDCSSNKVIYWMNQYGIPRRTISEAIYHIHNPDGNPFTIKPITSIEEAKLFGIGLGLYWGEGNKANKYSVRLGNTDPELLKMFIKFLVELYGIDKERLRFGLQLFSDISIETALNYWVRHLAIAPEQFYKVTVTPSGSIGTYRKKSPYGVVTVYFHNKKLRDIIVGLLPR